MSRGVLFPGRLPTFHRAPAIGEVSNFVRWFWIPEWNVRPGHSSRQHLIGFPACNLIVENGMTGISGPTTRASYRDLAGTGWAVGALLRPAAVPALVNDVARIRDAYQPVSLPELARKVHSAMDTEASIEERHRAATCAFARWLLNYVGAPSDEALLANRMVEAVESHPNLATVTELAAELSISVRSLQRLAAKYVGLPPVALIRRRRLQEAAAKLRDDPSLDLTALAHRFGYADHAHLTREFRSGLGLTPSEYRRTLSAERSRPRDDAIRPSPTRHGHDAAELRSDPSSAFACGSDTVSSP